jgi:beta-glucanase (GH16 family)
MMSVAHRSRILVRATAGTALLASLLVPLPPALAQDVPAAAPKFLFDADPAHSAGKIVDGKDGVTATPRDGGIDVLVSGGPAGYPGFAIVPAQGTSWDLSPWGHVKARVTNTGDAQISVNLRVDNQGPWQNNPWNTESVGLKPGETKEAKVIFGHQYGYKPGYKLNPGAVVQVLFFLGKSDKDRSFRIEDIQAGGPAGEKPPVDPNAVIIRPEGGVILGAGAKLDPPAKVEAKDGAQAALGEGQRLVVDVPAGKAGSVVVKPAMGAWNLGLHHEVKVTLRNTGTAAAMPRVRLESRGGPSDTFAATAPLAPGAETTIAASFVAAKPWVGVSNPKDKHNGGVPGTGARFDSIRATGVTVLVDKAEAPVRLEVAAIVAAATPVVLPDWVGKRPPVAGDWTMTFEDTFGGEAIDLQRWNIYTANYWDKRTHFAKDNTIVKDGKLHLRYEKKTGLHNDDPEDKSPVAKTNFACGFADTYGKWTQRYGYFEARMKLPTCPGLWPAFWMMPDRGEALGPQWKRASTHSGGMEFDIMEHLTAWGPYRFNVAMHWDGYEKDHKAIGSSNVYVPTDKDGFFTIGLLWTPGSAIFYGNGEEIGRWEHERICTVQSYMILYMVSGGWANVPLDEAQLPADFVIDYVRAWQRQDLATPEDGPKPNDGRPKSQF